MKKQPIIVRAVKSFLDDDVPSMAAQLAFYINTAFFPFVIFLFIIISSTPILDESALYDLIAFLPNRAGRVAPGYSEQISCDYYGRCVYVVNVKRCGYGVARP